MTITYLRISLLLIRKTGFIKLKVFNMKVPYIFVNIKKLLGKLHFPITKLFIVEIVVFNLFIR